jgi:murein DD-endopeptidase MepM/ murein hydrolase activator NlpD
MGVAPRWRMTERIHLSSVTWAVLLSGLASACSAPDGSSEPVEIAQSAIHASNVLLCQQPIIPPVTCPPGQSTCASGRVNQYLSTPGALVVDLWSNTDKADWLLSLRPKMPFLAPFTANEASVITGWVRSATPGDGHGGIDYLKGTGVSFKARAVAPGRVISVLAESQSLGEGNSVTIEHYGRDGMRYRSIYVHLRDGAVHDCLEAQKPGSWPSRGPGGWASGYQVFMQNQNCASGSVDQSIWGPESSPIQVAVGDMVTAGQIIGDVGQTGWGAIGRSISSGGVLSGNRIHLHLYFGAHAPPEGRPAVNPNAEWILIDPHGVYGYVSTPNCYLRAASTAGYSMFGPASRNDFDRDSKTDFTIVRPGSNGKATWWVLTQTHLQSSEEFGNNWDTPTPGDYDGDGTIDVSTYSPDLDGVGSGNLWFVNPSSGSGTTTTSLGVVGDIPVPGDYNGDGMTDKAVFRPSTHSWLVMMSPQVVVTTTVFGDLSDDIPVPGDYDGDGRTDYAVYRTTTGEWRARLSGGGQDMYVQWGATGDVPIPADYDGDGKTDVAVYRPFEQWSGIQGKWYIIYSSTGGQPSPQPIYGYWNDKPVPGDYDGDGRADVAIFSASRSGTWFVQPSGGGGEIAQPWGASTDIIP